MKGSENDTGVIDAVMQNYQVEEVISAAKQLGWEQVWQEFKKTYDTAAFQNDQEKNIWVDLFLSHCLKLISPIAHSQAFWETIERWFECRKLENRTGALSNDEKVALIHFVLNLRVKMHEFLLKTPVKPDILTDHQQRLMIAVWRQLFFEPFSALNLFWHPKHKQQKLTEECKNNGYIGLLVASMYQPFAADEYNVDSEKLVAAELPFGYKHIIIYWMLNTPYFNAEEKHRLKLVRYVPELCRAINRHPEMLTTAFFLTFVQEVMTGFWRASYIGGNHVDALSAFGDFISFTINRFMPHPKAKLVRKDLAKGEKIRIGYISRNFYKQAVSCYMVNRVIHHDRDKFEVYVFALGDYHDNISELFKQNSHSFERFNNITDFYGIAKSILEKKLDILIYTDIGMDPVTYILSGLQLAPVQCALVGHGTSTGMPTIQYYISGDFEAPSAQNQYREKLVRLPNLGAAQYMPIVPEEKLTRAELGIPEDAVVFISCANGIKHGHLRDALFVEILKQAPN
ncbi:MAG: glycosyl transferase family 1, partial [Negativicutes bacterium]|nr:glycosyl transferase family 1 [Negativicutes bacterium]